MNMATPKTVSARRAQILVLQVAAGVTRDDCTTDEVDIPWRPLISYASCEARPTLPRRPRLQAAPKRRLRSQMRS
jgi:hypothetical protein